MATFDDVREGPGQRPDPEESCPEGLRADERNGSLSASREKEPCRDILHGLNNALVSILLNAQLIEWKLPSYSRLKRNVHEVERSARRGGVLVQRLRDWLEIGVAGDFPKAERELQYAAADTSQIGAGRVGVVPGGEAVDRDEVAELARGG